MASRSITLALFLLLSGCATAPESKPQFLLSEVEATLHDANSCYVTFKVRNKDTVNIDPIISFETYDINGNWIGSGQTRHWNPKGVIEPGKYAVSLSVRATPDKKCREVHQIRSLHEKSTAGCFYNSYSKWCNILVKECKDGSKCYIGDWTWAWD